MLASRPLLPGRQQARSALAGNTNHILAPGRTRVLSLGQLSLLPGRHACLLPLPGGARRVVRSAAVKQPDARPYISPEAEVLNGQFGVPGYIRFNSGKRGLTRVWLKHPNGQGVEVYLRGAAVTQWIRPNGTDLLYRDARPASDDASSDEQLDPAISVAFPQYREGLMVENGFARQLDWEVVETGFDCQPVRVSRPWLEALRYKSAKRRKELGVPLPRSASLAAGTQAPSLTDLMTSAAAAEGQAARGDAGAASSSGSGGAAGPSPAGRGPSVARMPPWAQQYYARTGTSPISADGLEEDLWPPDPAPYIVLRLTDNETTRSIWPHAFELTYKLTLMETDEQPEVRKRTDLPLSTVPFSQIHPLTGEKLQSPEQDWFTPGLGSQEALAMMAKLEQASAKSSQAAAQEAEPEDTAAPAAAAAAPPAGARGFRTSLWGTRTKKDEEAAARTANARAAASRGGRGGRRVNKPGSVQDDSADDGLALTGCKCPIQLKAEFTVVNKDAAGGSGGPMQFQLATLPRFATQDLMRNGPYVKTLGLGGLWSVDYSASSTSPRLKVCTDDYQYFKGDRIDTTFVDAAGADVKLCPGERTHFELELREGFRDVVLQQPGYQRAYASHEQRHAVVLGQGRVMLPQSLEAGESWKAVSVIRYHPRYWPVPVFGDPSIPMQRLQTSRAWQDTRKATKGDPFAAGWEGGDTTASEADSDVARARRLAGGPQQESSDTGDAGYESAWKMRS